MSQNHKILFSHINNVHNKVLKGEVEGELVGVK